MRGHGPAPRARRKAEKDSAPATACEALLEIPEELGSLGMLGCGAGGRTGAIARTRMPSEERTRSSPSVWPSVRPESTSAELMIVLQSVPVTRRS